jgi:tRNA(Ile)-lysidine synthase
VSAKSLPFSPERLLKTLRGLPATHAYRVAYSGGADSTALLHALHAVEDRLDAGISALHVNHGLHPDCNAWQARCERFCDALGIHIECVQIAPDRDAGTGLEADARRLRYGAAEARLRTGEMLLTAHHSDDQAETVLLNLMRGSGVDGLAGMPRLRPLGKGWLARPLLQFDGAALRRYLENCRIDWIEDESNRDDAYDRNYLRNRLMPLLANRWRRAAEKIALSASHCREASQLLDQLADDFLGRHQPHPRVLDCAALPSKEPAMFKLVVRRWLQHRGASPLPARRIEELSRQLAAASAEHHIGVAWADWTMHYYRGHLWLQAKADMTPCPTLAWRGAAALDLGPVVGRLEIEPLTERLPDGWQVAPRRPGAAIRSKGGGHRSVKQLLQEARIPPWLRSSVPVIWVADEAVALGDWVVAPMLREWLDRRDAAIRWRPREPVLKYVRKAARAGPVDPVSPLG